MQAWRYSDALGTARISVLESARPLSAMLDDIVASAQVLCVHRPCCNDLSGFSRVIATLRVPPNVFDVSARDNCPIRRFQSSKSRTIISQTYKCVSARPFCPNWYRGGMVKRLPLWGHRMLCASCGKSLDDDSVEKTGKRVQCGRQVFGEVFPPISQGSSFVSRKA